MRKETYTLLLSEVRAKLIKQYLTILETSIIISMLMLMLVLFPRSVDYSELLRRETSEPVT